MTYPFFIVKQHRGFILFSVVVIGALQYLIIELMTTVDPQTVFDAVVDQLPERFRMLITEAFITRMTIDGTAAFGFNHPLVLALLAINAINIPTRHIAGEIEFGTMEWLLAHPVRRGQVLLSLWTTACAVVLLIICGAWIGSLSALAINQLFSQELLLKMLKIGTNLWLLIVLILSFTMLIAVFGREGSKIGLRAAAITLGFYFLHFLSALWDFIGFTKPINIFTYYQPQKLMSGERSFALNACVLLALIAVCLWISVRQFQRRDIPG